MSTEMDAKVKDAITRGAKALDAASFAMSSMAQQESGPLAEMFAIWLMEEADRLADLVRYDERGDDAPASPQ